MAKTQTAGEVPFIVKVCGVTAAEDLEASLEAGANAIGFNFYAKSPRFLTTESARQLTQAVRRDYIKVGVFVNPTEDELLEIASSVQLDVLQLHGSRSPIQLANSFRVWQAGQAGMDREKLDPHVEAWLLDTPTAKHGGSGKTFDWSLAADFPRRAIVAGGLDSSNVAEAIRIARPWGVDGCSRLETRPGQKDRARIQAFVEAALAAFQAHEFNTQQETHS